MKSPALVPSFIADRVDSTLIHPTRIHLLREQPSPTCRLWIKREDESVYGSKQRKYASLIPALKAQGVTAIALLGSMGSNHLVAATQLLRQAGIALRLVLREGHSDARAGNPLLLKLLTQDEERWLISRKDWPHAAEIAAERMRQTFGATSTLVLPEGGFHPWSLPGALTLGIEIDAQAQQMGLNWDRMVTDAGTGLTGASLWLSSHLMKTAWKLEVLTRAASPDEMRSRWGQVADWMRQLHPMEMDAENMPAFSLPTESRSFGSVSRKCLSFITRFAHTEGILLDPLYNGPLIEHVYERCIAEHWSGDVLVIHGGGTQALHGFHERLSSA